MLDPEEVTSAIETQQHQIDSSYETLLALTNERVIAGTAKAAGRGNL
jgi:hypothetical protein